MQNKGLFPVLKNKGCKSKWEMLEIITNKIFKLSNKCTLIIIWSNQGLYKIIIM